MFYRHHPSGEALVCSLSLCSAAAANSGEQQGNARRRAGKGNQAAKDGAEEAGGKDADTTDETLQISVETFGEVQSDLNPQDPLQKVVRFSSDLSLLMTGGTDGHIRVWEVGRLRRAVCETRLFRLVTVLII